MSIFKEITNELLKKTQFKEQIESRIESSSLQYSISGMAETNNPRVQDVLQMLIAMQTELMEENSVRIKQRRGNSFIDYDKYTDTNFARISSCDREPYPLFSRFLNTYDKDGKSLNVLLEKLKANSGEELSDIIFKEIVPIYKQWVEIYDNADPYLKLQLNHVNADEIEAIRRVEEFGLFNSIITNGNGHDTYLYDPETFVSIDPNRRGRQDIVNQILREYKYDIPLIVELTDGMYIASTGDEFFKVGVGKDDKFVFEILDTEILINGYMIDFSDTKGNTEKSNEVKTLLHMVFIGSVETLETKDLTDNEAVTFSMLYLHNKSSNLHNECWKHLDYDESIHILKSLGEDKKNEFNKNFEFSDSAKTAIKDFADKIRPDQMVSINHLPIINMLHKIGADKVNTDHLDLWCIISEVNNRSPLVKTVNGLVDDYRNDRKETSELLAIAKKLDNDGLLLLESKLICCGIEPQKFQKELSKPEIKARKYKM